MAWVIVSGIWGAIYGAIVGSAWALALGIDFGRPVGIGIAGMVGFSWLYTGLLFRNPAATAAQAGDTVKGATILACVAAGVAWFFVR